MSGWSKRPDWILRLARAALFLPTLLLFAARGRAQEPSAPDITPAPIRVQVNLVSVSVAVTDETGHFVDSLQKENFLVLDNGVEQPLTHFAAVAEPAQVLLLVESGPAVYLLESGHLQSAYALLNGLSRDDRVAIIGYAERPLPILDFTTDKTAAAGALGELRFNLGYGELNLSASLHAVLDWLGYTPGKKTIVLLSTGVDTSPPSIAESLLARLKTGDVRVLAIALGGELRETKPKSKQKVLPEKAAAAEEEFAQADAWLKAIAEASGGRAYFPKNAKEFRAVYAEIAQLVRHEYSLGFAPSQRDGKVHPIDVRVRPAPEPATSPGYRVDHRQAYVAPRPDTN